jgi:hypothetical protein
LFSGLRVVPIQNVMSAILKLAEPKLDTTILYRDPKMTRQASRFGESLNWMPTIYTKRALW